MATAERFLVSNMWEAVPARDVKPEFIAGTDRFWYVFKTTKATDYYLVTPSKKSVQHLFDKREFVAALTKITGKPYDERHLKLFPRFADDGKSFMLDIDGKRIRYDLATKKCQEEQLPKREPYKAPNRRQQMMKYSKNSTIAAYCKGHDLYIEQLAERHKFIDLSRVGIFGHSGGGFMSATALMTYPDFYKVAVASSGNHDNNMFHLEWGETFHGVKQEVVRGDTVFKCKIPTNLELAKNLKGHLLLVTGDKDNNVHPGHTYRLADALIKAGKQFDMLVLPGQGHLYKGAAADYWRRRIWLYFMRHLHGRTESDDYIDMDFKK